jgi:hypothetical protein
MHCLKYQAVVAPDGLLVHFFGPIEGRYHDRTAWRMSGIDRNLGRHAWDLNGTALQLYGDPAYGVSRHLLSAFRGARTTAQEREWNKQMSKVRIVIEWEFKEVITIFPHLDAVKKQKILLSPVALEYQVAVLLHKPQITQYFAKNLAEVGALLVDFEEIEDEIP